MSKKSYKIPFTDGNMVEWTPYKEGETRTGASWNWEIPPDEWRENNSFWAELVLDGCAKGRSAVRFYVINATDGEHYGERYSLGMAAFYEAVMRFGVRNKSMYGTWQFRKQGMNYGLVPVFGENE